MVSKFHFFVIKLKALFLPAIICLFILFLLIFSNTNLIAAKQGLYLWANSVLPSLLPFLIATELLGYTNVIKSIGKLLNKFMYPIFNVPGEGAFALIMGIVSGYPIGAKVVSNLKDNGICNSIQAERLLAFTNNSGPLFIVGTIGIGLFNSFSIGITLLITHILSSISVGILFRWWKKSKETTLRNHSYSIDSSTLNFCNLGEILSKSILNSINTSLIIGGFIVLFSIIISILQASHILVVLSNILRLIGLPNFLSEALLMGFIEVTNGLSCVSNLLYVNLNFKIILCAFILGFGGFSVLLQILSIISKSNISVKPYFIGKLLQAFFAAFYTYLII